MKWERYDDNPLTMFTLVLLWGKGNKADMMIKLSHIVQSTSKFSPVQRGSNYSQIKDRRLIFQKFESHKKSSHAQHRVVSLEKSGLQKYKSEHKIFHHGRGRNFIPDFSFSKFPHIWKTDPSGPFALSLDRWWGGGIHAKKDFCCGDGYLGKKNLRKIWPKNGLKSRKFGLKMA